MGSTTGDAFFEHGEVALRYRLEGEGPLVTLNHAVGSYLDSWDGVVARLGDAFTLLRYDMRGHGQSTKVPGPYWIDDFVTD